MLSKLDRACFKTWLSSEKCTRGEDGRETAKRKPKKEDAGPAYGAKGQEDQLCGVKERSREPGRMASSSVEPALGQSTQEEEWCLNIFYLAVIFLIYRTDCHHLHLCDVRCYVLSRDDESYNVNWCYRWLAGGDGHKGATVPEPQVVGANWAATPSRGGSAQTNWTARAATDHWWWRTVYSQPLLEPGEHWAHWSTLLNSVACFVLRLPMYYRTGTEFPCLSFLLS